MNETFCRYVLKTHNPDWNNHKNLFLASQRQSLISEQIFVWIYWWFSSNHINNKLCTRKHIGIESINITAIKIWTAFPGEIKEAKSTSKFNSKTKSRIGQHIIALADFAKFIFGKLDLLHHQSHEERIFLTTNFCS